MKKTIILIIAALLIAGAAVTAFFLLSGDKEKEMEEKANAAGLTHLELLKLDDNSELKTYLAEHDFILQTSDDESLTSVGSVPISGHYMTLYFQTDDNGAIYRVDGILDFALKNREVSELKVVFDRFCDAVAELFSISRSFDYSVYALEGYELDSASDESLQKVLEGQAEFSLSVIDTDGSYWNAVATVDEADRVSFYFFHSFDFDEDLDESRENIVLTAPAGTEG